MSRDAKAKDHRSTARRSRSRWLLVAFVCLVLAAAVGWWLYSGFPSEELRPGMVVASGRIEGRRVHISSGADGRVLQLSVREGGFIEPGDVIATIDPRVEQAALSVARAVVRAAEASEQAAKRQAGALEADLAFARKEARRYSKLHEQGVATGRTAEQARATAGRLEQQLRAAEQVHHRAVEQTAAARAELEAAQVHSDETTVESPVAGVVEHELVRSGETVGVGSPLVVMIQPEETELRVYVPLVDAQRITPGDPARVYLEGFPDRFFPGNVARVANEAEFTPKDVHTPDERTTLVFAVDIDVPNPQRRLKDGMPADAYIRWNPQSPWPRQRPWE